MTGQKNDDLPPLRLPEPAHPPHPRAGALGLYFGSLALVAMAAYVGGVLRTEACWEKAARVAISVNGPGGFLAAQRQARDLMQMCRERRYLPFVVR